MQQVVSTITNIVQQYSYDITKIREAFLTQGASLAAVQKSQSDLHIQQMSQGATITKIYKEQTHILSKLGLLIETCNPTSW